MTISAEVVADSIQHGGNGSRLTTLVLTYPRFVHAEFMTHRVFSRNASSSRAIPVEKMIAAVRDNPFVPIHWGKNQPGMQAREELSDAPPPWSLDPMVSVEDMSSPRFNAKVEWARAQGFAIMQVNRLLEIGLHKQIANRLLEPFAHITVVATATRWDNFYGLRCSDQAEPHMERLAESMLAAMNASEPRFLEGKEWHLPFILDEERQTQTQSQLIRSSVARCARVSYLNHDKTLPDLAKDTELYERLLKSGHMSPFEHQAYVPCGTDFVDDRPNSENDNVQNSRYTSARKFGRSGGNLGDEWVQHRKLIENETIKKFDRLIIKSSVEAAKRRYNTTKDQP